MMLHLSGLPSEMLEQFLLLCRPAPQFAAWQEVAAARVDQVQAQQPDLVVLIGDIFEGHGQPPEGLIPVWRRLSAPLGVWAVRGNHEFHGRYERGTAPVRSNKLCRLTVLNNSWQKSGLPLYLPVLTTLLPTTALVRRRSHFQALAGRPPGRDSPPLPYTVQAEKAASAGVGLMLSGHTHRGQIWPFGYLVQHIPPACKTI